MAVLAVAVALTTTACGSESNGAPQGAATPQADVADIAAEAIVRDPGDLAGPISAPTSLDGRPDCVDLGEDQGAALVACRAPVFYTETPSIKTVVTVLARVDGTATSHKYVGREGIFDRCVASADFCKRFTARDLPLP